MIEILFSCCTISTLNIFSYIINGLITVESCDRLIQEAQIKKDSLLVRKTSLMGMMHNAEESRTELQSELDVVIQKITTLEATIATMPAGSARTRKEAERYRHLSKKMTIEAQLLSDNTELYVERQYSLAIVELSLVEIDLFIAAVTARRSEIENA